MTGIENRLEEGRQDSGERSGRAIARMPQSRCLVLEGGGQGVLFHLEEEG